VSEESRITAKIYPPPIHHFLEYQHHKVLCNHIIICLFFP